ncbi:hypothetical protein PQX77_015025 [Marasmius sp. AFHP31]|nr:hypothetical protein PQX77_015025 [Marasmius sp. AFHP31]
MDSQQAPAVDSERHKLGTSFRLCQRAINATTSTGTTPTSCIPLLHLRHKQDFLITNDLEHTQEISRPRKPPTTAPYNSGELKHGRFERQNEAYFGRVIKSYDSVPKRSLFRVCPVSLEARHGL